MRQHLLRLMVLILLGASAAWSNDFYNASGVPATGGPGSSAQMRTEFGSIATGFDKMPALAGNGNKPLIVNGGGTAIGLTTGTLALGGNFAISGAFATTLTVTNTTTLTLPVTGTLATLAGSETLTTKTINLTSNTLSGTTAQFNTALSDNDFATLAGSESLTNKTIPAPVLSGTVTGTYTLAGTPTITSPTINGATIGTATIVAPAISSPTLSGTPVIPDNVFTVGGSADATKKLAFEVDGLTTSTTRTATVPDRSGTLAFDTTVASYTSNTTLGAGVGLALLSGAGFVLTMPAAASHTNREVTILDQGTSLTQFYTITGNAAETIVAPDGTANTYILYTMGEELRLKSNGTSWYVISHKAITDWTDVGVMTITGTTSNPTKPTTPDIDKVYWRRNGNQVFLRYILQTSSAAGSAAGSGNYLFALPTDITFDSTVMTPVATTLGGGTRSEASPSFLNGVGMAGIDNSSFNQCTFYAQSTSTFQVFVSGTLNNELGSGTVALTSAELAYNFELSARAANWRL